MMLPILLMKSGNSVFSRGEIRVAKTLTAISFFAMFLDGGYNLAFAFCFGFFLFITVNLNRWR